MLKYDELIKNINILLIDDDEDYITMTYAFFKQLGYNVEKAICGEEAIKKLDTNKYQIALLDYFMPDLNGEEVVEKIREKNKELIIILQTGFSGQKPPVETMKRLNIQNYHDKTEGIDRLNLEIISAVKIFNQQNEIELKKYKTNAIGNLMSGVAQEIKNNLLTISAGMELTNILVNDNTAFSKQNAEDLSKYYRSNKDSLERIDKILTSLINQSTENTDYVMADVDILDVIKLITDSISKRYSVMLNVKMALKPNSYISGGINDTIFVVCELIRKLMEIEKAGSIVNLSLAEDENKWYFTLTSDNIKNLPKNRIYLVNKVMKSIKGADLVIDELEENKLTIALDKNPLHD